MRWSRVSGRGARRRGRGRCCSTAPIWLATPSPRACDIRQVIVSADAPRPAGHPRHPRRADRRGDVRDAPSRHLDGDGRRQPGPIGQRHRRHRRPSRDGGRTRSTRRRPAGGHRRRCPGPRQPRRHCPRRGGWRRHRRRRRRDQRQSVRMEGAARIDGQRPAPADCHPARHGAERSTTRDGTAVESSRRFRGGGDTHVDADLRGPLALLVGGEGAGLPSAAHCGGGRPRQHSDAGRRSNR